MIHPKTLGAAMAEADHASDMRGGGRVLAVILHGWRASPDQMLAVRDVVVAELGQSVQILMPDLAYSSIWCVEPAAEIVRLVLGQIDAELNERPADNIILIGHSLGAVIARRTYLAACGSPPGFSCEFPLSEELPRSWSGKVSRIVMLAAFNRGWHISQRMGWIYSIWFNIIGLAGHLLMLGNRRPTIFDIRLGAPFIVQTRLHWLAHRRARRKAGTGHLDPLVIQLRGTQDDLVSPFDQVDIAVDGTSRSAGGHDNAGQRYFFIELPETDHKSSVKLYAEPVAGQARRANQRGDIFAQVLKADQARLQEMSVPPEMLVDAMPEQDLAVRHVVFVIHGIRDDGFWTHHIAERVRETARKQLGQAGKSIFRSWTPSYGYFAIAPFLLPWVRRVKVEWLMDQYVSAHAQYPGAADFDFVGHSNGTYLLARALLDYPAARFRRVYFAGSVVRGDYDWQDRVRHRQVEQFLNVRASRDCVVGLLPKSLEWWKSVDVGGGGFDGFEQAGQSAQVQQVRLYAHGGHGAAIGEKHWQGIAEFIALGKVPEPVLTGRARPEPGDFVDGPPGWLRFLAGLRICLPVLVVLILSAGVWILSPLIWHLHGLSPRAAAASAFGFAVYVALLRFFILRF